MTDEESKAEIVDEEAAVERAVDIALGIDWAELGMVEYKEKLHRPTSIRRRKKDGSLKEVPIMICMVSNPQRFKARVRSRKWAEELSLDLERDKDLVEELEHFEILAYAIRDAEDPYDQHVPNGKHLYEMYLLSELSEQWALHQQMVDVCDPRFGELTPKKMWSVVAAIAVRGEPTPLSGMPGFEQATCMTFMAREACNSPNAPSYVRSLSTSGSD